jgi:hypothetical protein
MLLARRSGSSELFRVIGFELIEETNPAYCGGNQRGPYSLLPVEEKKPNSLSMLLERMLPPSKKRPSPIGLPPYFPSQSELKDIFAISDPLNFGEIEWAGFNCPACHTNFQFTDGESTTWCHCSACSRIYCAGNLHNTPLGVHGHCPWCGRVAKITKRLKPGEQADIPVRGEVGRSKGDVPRLKDAAIKQLPDKKNK